ncbi:MAG: hypothetical protein ACK4YF_07670 [Exilispira sp.]
MKKILVTIVISLICISFTFYKILQENDVEIFSYITSIKENGNEYKLFISNTYLMNFIFVTCSTYDNINFHFYPEEIHSIIYSVFDQNKIRQFIISKNLDKNIYKIYSNYKNNKISFEINLSDYILPYLTDYLIKTNYSIKDKRYITEIYPNNIFYLGIKFKIFDEFYIKFNKEYQILNEKLKQWISDEINKMNLNVILRILSKELKLEKVKLNIILSISMKDNLNNLLKVVPSYTKFDENYSYIFVKKNKENYPFICNFYFGDYINIFAPFNGYENYNFIGSFAHEIFHFFQENIILENMNFKEFVKNIIHENSYIYHLYDEYLFILGNYYEIYKDKIGSYLYEIIKETLKNKKFDLFYEWNFFSFFATNYGCFKEFSSDIFKKWFCLKNLQYNSYTYYIPDKFFEDKEVQTLIKNSDNILNKDFWKKIIIFYLKSSLQNINKDFNYSLKNISENK